MSWRSFLPFRRPPPSIGGHWPTSPFPFATEMKSYRYQDLTPAGSRRPSTRYRVRRRLLLVSIKRTNTKRCDDGRLCRDGRPSNLVIVSNEKDSTTVFANPQEVRAPGIVASENIILSSSCCCQPPFQRRLSRTWLVDSDFKKTLRPPTPAHPPPRTTRSEVGGEFGRMREIAWRLSQPRRCATKGGQPTCRPRAFARLRCLSPADTSCGKVNVDLIRRG